MSKAAIDIDHFSDVLCVWAYIAQIRVDELRATFPEDVTIEYRFLQVFGDVPGKMATQWADRGGLEAYAAHVQEVAAKFEHVEINPRAWIDNPPASSMPAHLFLCGASVSQDTEKVEQLLRAFRHAFFVDLVDISNHQNLLAIARQAGVDMKALQATIDCGAAHARLAADLAAAAQSSVRSSPTMTFNDGRQILSGNFGYRVLEANVRELLRSPSDQQSWC